MGSLFVSISVFLLLTCFGCVESASQQCANGSVCPEGLICEEARQECLPPSQIAACKGIPNAAACSFVAGVGTCLEGVCVLLACGDGEIRGPEVCDDGNHFGGDGCAADCLSDERCGNLIVDFEAGETCDDGSFLSGDGCSSTCQVEYPVWTAKPAPPPIARRGHAMAYDLSGRRAILFGGFDGDGRLDDTWQWEGTSWSQLNTETFPSAREEHAMSYDAVTAQVVLFGGYSESSGYHDDTWQLEGRTWSQASPPQAPSARSEHAMVYDAARQSIVLFGGKGMQGVLADTWLWTEGTWQTVTLPLSPEARSGHSLAYDVARQKVILFGGINEAGVALGDTWQWDGTLWSEMSLDTSPPARHGHAMSYDANKAKLVLYGGYADSELADVWSLEGNTWMPSGQALAGGREGHVLCYDPVLRKLVLLGGRMGTVLLADTWLGDDAGFLESTNNQPDPALIVDNKSVYDAGRQRVVVPSTTYLNGQWDMLEWDGQKWETITPELSPPGRSHFALAYDPVNSEVILFGGIIGTIRQNDIWAWNGASWTERTPIESPPPRAHHVLAYDAIRKEVVLFGGEIGSPTGYQPIGDTWAWNGTTWRELLPSTSPSPRLHHSMAFDAHSQNIVLHGGLSKQGELVLANAETWLWDGKDWSPMESELLPDILSRTSLVYYAPRQRMWLISTDNGAGSFVKIWERVGTNWQVMYLSQDLPSPVGRSSACFDLSRGEVVVVEQHQAAVYAIRFQDQGEAERCALGGDFDLDGKVGCDDPDCWGICTPNCLPGGLGDCDESAPHCGDMSCDTPHESDLSCPMDCMPSALCGDYLCDALEVCAGDCL